MPSPLASMTMSSALSSLSAVKCANVLLLIFLGWETLKLSSKKSFKSLDLGLDGSSSRDAYLLALLITPCVSDKTISVPLCACDFFL